MDNLEFETLTAKKAHMRTLTRALDITSDHKTH
jgi:hypothetical protein